MRGIKMAAAHIFFIVANQSILNLTRTVIFAITYIKSRVFYATSGVYYLYIK